jgi:hypothetical protein
MTETTVGREPVQIVEIFQPKCSRTYGVAPCTAAGAVGSECFNSRATCDDTANFALGTPLSLYFSSGRVAEIGVSGASYIIPSLAGVSTSPTRINLAGANPDAQGLGNRAICSIRLIDHPHTDRLVDPYVNTRAYDPLTKGSFWTKWLVRNKYRQNVKIRVYDGYAGQALSAMTRREYFLQSIQGPDAAGNVTIQGKDILSRIEERKAQAPVASPGELYANITAGATSFEVANAILADYPSAGTIKIGEELMTYTSTSTTANGVTFSGVTRGTDNTTAAAHSAIDAVQECLRYTTARVDDILYDLLVNYGGIDAAWLDTAGMATEFDDYLPSYLLTTLITEPTSVSDLVSEIQEQALCFVWWDERASLVKMKAIRGIDAEPPTLTAEANIIEGSLSFSEMPRQRASQVRVYYNRNKFIKGVQDSNSYPNLHVDANLESESNLLYGEASIRTIYGRWLPTDALAANTASKILVRYVDIPNEVVFRMDAKDRSYWVGDTVKISHHLDVDKHGDRRIRQWTIVSAEEVVPGETVEYTAEDTTLYGRIHYIMASGAADYPGAALAPFKNFYIGDANGLLSDGSPCGRIS